ncbi:type IV toxin-antitoxin system AbiEi family antitoxin [uncultured Microbacterium sp.]|uniref:type IV toxin-antitoxin system AbiEi family antitoxin n=1 Tax=uncultured Microbacterium sp. TaxID=191216 RepID=UPI0025FE819F|nr:type IV toxin-antitoxin system AbiEi family antitoxin [uncultured Microbacterium sp.]
MVSPFLFFPGERLSLAELTAACLDGDLVALGEGFIPADAVETPWMRAHSLLPLLGSRWAATRVSAAWVHGAIAQEPACHQLQRVSPTRLRIRSGSRAEYHDLRMPSADVELVAGVHVSTPSRTLADLARSAADADEALAREWASRDPGLAAAAKEWLSRHPRYPHARRAAGVLEPIRTR